MKKNLRALGVVIAALSMIALAGCSSDPGTSTETMDAADLSPEAQAALQVVTAASESVDEFTAPGPAVDASALAGETVYYIPMALQIPLLNNLGTALTSALENVGATVQVCDAKLNPADAASCILQAIDADAAAVITGGIPKEFATTSFDQLLAAGIPWVLSATTTSGDGDPSQVAYVSADNVLLQSWSTNWVIADSNAAANVLVIKLTDSEATTAWADYGILATYEQGCADCTVQVVETNSGQLDKLPSLISSALIANPDITYIQAEFDQFLPSVSQGIQSAARDDITVVSVDGQLSTLQEIAAGGDVKAVAAYNQDAAAWYTADAVVRLTSGAEAVGDLSFPFRRIFTTENVGNLTLTADAQASGEWFGDADYRAGFLELWGVN